MRPTTAIAAIALTALAALPVLARARAQVENMNRGGVPYAISNGADRGGYSTNFQENVHGEVEYFDVYGEVRTRYSQVYWTRNTPINLPPALVERFKGKVMAITGYEVDQVTHEGPQPGSTTKGDVLGGFACYPSCEGTDKSVPEYHAYNHHYFSWLVGHDAVVFDREQPTKLPNPTRTGFMDLPHDHAFPTNIVFKENPGGEFRKSYHGYPSGYAQLVHSPETWVVEPMQIDTHNRNYNITDEVGYHEWFLPAADSNESMTDRHSGLSPLIECPCTDRIARTVEETSPILTSGNCPALIDGAAACFAAVAGTGAHVTSNRTVSDASLPAGCLVAPSQGKDESYDATFNADLFTAVGCGVAGADPLRGAAHLGGLTNLTIDHDGTTAEITLSGPDGVWFGVGFDASQMGDLPYTIVVDGTGAVTERKLGNHAPGTLLKSSVTVISSEAHGGVRTVVLRRPVAGASPDHWTVPTSPGKVPLITAVGNTPTFAYHKDRTASSITLLPKAASACVCAPHNATYLTYMNRTKQEFHYDCLDEPRSDMLRHGDGTGRSVENMACKMQTYHGGLRCCVHSWFLTDRAQDSRIPADVDVYFLKWRYYFQEYTPATPAAPASHVHLHHWVFLIDANVNDYEEDNARYGEKSIGKIEAHLTASQMGLEDIPTSFSGITPYVMTPHCHAPSCIREELWNADTNELICNVSVLYGDEKHGSTKTVFNEANYVSIPPCIWGHQTGLRPPVTLKPGTNLTAIKYFNNTYRHLGQMAQWTGLMVYEP